MSRVVVTGAAKGIGAAIAQAFAAQGEEVTALSHGELDVSDEAAVTNMFEGLGQVDVLVNNAGIAQSAALHRTTLESWQRHFEVNVTGAFLCLRAVLPGMRERGGGAIVNVASVAGLSGAPYIAAYAASKHALVGLTRAAAAELGGTGIRVNAVCPGFVRTDMTERTIANIVSKTGRSAQDAERSLGVLLEPSAVAAAVVFLASPAAASINGQALVIDGGGLQA